MEYMKSSTTKGETKRGDEKGYRLLPVDQIREDPNQPRRNIDQAALEEMAATIKSVGVIEPVVVRPSGKGYMLVVGHRRLRAARIAGLKVIPCVVREDVDELEVMRMQAVEDVQTEELDPRDRYAFWAKLWHAERKATPSLTLDQFAHQTIGKSVAYVRAGIQVAEEAPAELRELLGKPEEGKLNPTYARYIVNDSSLSSTEKVAVARKIAKGVLPASGGRIGTETLRVIRAAPEQIRKRLIHDSSYGLEQAQWEMRHAAREEVAKEAKAKRTVSSAEVAFRLLRAELDLHTKMDPRIAPFLPAIAWGEIALRTRNLIARLEEFLKARSERVDGRELLDVIDVTALGALLAQEDESDQASSRRLGPGQPSAGRKV